MVASIPASSGDDASRTPTRSRVASEAASARQRSRAPSKLNLGEEEAGLLSPATARGQRSAMRKTSSEASDGQLEPPATPSRRSTRTAAIKATGLIHDTVEEISGSRRRATPARKTEHASGLSSGEDAPKTPSRRAKEPPTMLLSPTTRRATRSSSAERELEDTDALTATPRKRAARKPAANESSDDNAESKIKTPARRGRPPKLATDDVEEAAEAIKSPTRRGRGRAAKASSEVADDEAMIDGSDSRGASVTLNAAPVAKKALGSSVTLPPPHPDLVGVAKKLASMAVELVTGDAAATASSTQSVDGEAEEFRTAPESPEKPLSLATKDALDAAEDEISDLSDVEDPHFTKIMTAAAESETMSAAESIAGSDAETEACSVDTKRARGASMSKMQGTHIAFDSDVELDSEPEEPAIAAQHPQNDKQADSDSDEDDEAPEIVTSRAKVDDTAQDKPTGAPESDSDASNFAQPSSKSSKGSKKLRPRHRKRPISVTAIQHAASAMENMAKLNRRPGHVLPSEIPEEFRVDIDSELAARAAAAKGIKPIKSGDKLDLAVLEQFASESKKRSSDDGAADSKKRKKRKQDKRKRSEDSDSSRVISGIRVVATQPDSKKSLLENLAQSVPPQVRKFVKEKHGGKRVKRSDPLVAIARRSGQAAMNFLKSGN
ncbi:hypothetical protein GGI04_001994 [Coemansia thaxteri]|uniref:Uncharacterized protein n=1 Tax=Coemansia thaxteri TaxID=2663907 RepID=A0A9W8EMI6_9FUNG|nr:hypothetical protein GGI04_001994 [Coemansia thaxteri]KAJ2008697.1 hypothetical protein H4R26_000016 [Coemansia thaxteri]KAJ2473900.1 hypothetical protein GGI02_000519 [Coemansia sp. RSA 2322]KAJ2488075.1 hypothetical protein EV174_000181 [Coemansia sp. RSA 2320]